MEWIDVIDAQSKLVLLALVRAIKKKKKKSATLPEVVREYFELSKELGLQVTTLELSFVERKLYEYYHFGRLKLVSKREKRFAPMGELDLLEAKILRNLKSSAESSR